MGGRRGFREAGAGTSGALPDSFNELVLITLLRGQLAISYGHASVPAASWVAWLWSNWSLRLGGTAV